MQQETMDKLDTVAAFVQECGFKRYPEEACGFVLADAKGKPFCIECANKSLEPKEHFLIDPDDFLREMYLNTVGHDEKGMKRYEWMVNAIWSRKMTGPNRNEQAVAETMLNVISKKYIMLLL